MLAAVTPVQAGFILVFFILCYPVIPALLPNSGEMARYDHNVVDWDVELSLT